MILPGFNLYTMIDVVFDNMRSVPPAHQILTNRDILTPTNRDVAEINQLIIEERSPGDIHEFLCADHLGNPEDQISHPPELLNSFESSGLPPHLLKLKVRFPIMLLRNLNTSRGLCNGTRLIVRSFQQISVEQKSSPDPISALLSSYQESTLQLPLSQCPIGFTRTQFPVRLTFVMTINESQGQTFESIGLYLPEPVFAHDQPYVALSQVRTPTSIHITLDRKASAVFGFSGFYTRNAVWREVLDQE